MKFDVGILFVIQVFSRLQIHRFRGHYLIEYFIVKKGDTVLSVW